MTNLLIELEEEQDAWLASMAEYTGQSKAEIISELITMSRIKYMFDKVSQQEEFKTVTIREWLDEIGLGADANQILKEVDEELEKETPAPLLK